MSPRVPNLPPKTAGPGAAESVDDALPLRTEQARESQVRDPDRLEIRSSAKTMGASPAEGATLASPSATALPPRLFPTTGREWAVWVWDQSDDVLPSAESLVDSARAIGATTLYVNAYPLEGDHLQQLSEIIERAGAQGIRVELLMGNVDWIEAVKHPWIQRQIIGPLLDIKRSLPENSAALDVGIALHLDVEPHVTGEMTQDRMREYLSMLQLFSDGLEGQLPIHVDLPTWYGGLSVGGRPFVGAILEYVDQISIMAYVEPHEVQSRARPILQAVSEAGKEAIVGIEIDAQSSSGLTGVILRRQLESLDQTLSDDPSYSGYAGLALHHWRSLRRLR